MFHVVLALRADTHYSIVHCYHELSQRLGLILYHEELSGPSWPGILRGFTTTSVPWAR